MTAALHLSPKEQPLSHSLCFLSFFLLVLRLLAISALCGLIRERSKVLRLQNVQIRGLLILFLNGYSHPAQSVIELLSPAWKLSQTRDLYLSSCLLRRGRARGDKESRGGGGKGAVGFQNSQGGFVVRAGCLCFLCPGWFWCSRSNKARIRFCGLGFFECRLPVLTKKTFCQRKQLLPCMCACMCVYVSGDSAQVLCFPCAYTPLPVFPTASPALNSQRTPK